MKKNKRKHCPHKRAARLEQSLLRDVGLIFVAGGCGKVEAFSKSTLNEVPINRVMARSLSMGSYFWDGVLIVTGRDSNGKDYIKTEFINAPDKCKHSSIVSSLTSAHQDLISNFNPRHRLTAAWILFPYRHELNDKEIMKLLDDKGAFDYVSSGEVA